MRPDATSSTAETAGVTRRRLLFAGVATATGGVLGYRASPVRTATGLVFPRLDLFGVIERIEPPALVRLRSNGEKLVILQKNARLWRDHEVSLNAFVSGDEIAAQGTWNGGALWASDFGSAYRRVEGKVLRRDGQRLELDTAAALFTDDTLEVDLAGCVAKPLDEVVPGDTVVATARWDPELRRMVLLHVGVRDPS